MASSNKDKYNKTNKERIASAAAALAIKLKQEKKLKSELKPHFNELSREVKSHYSKHGKLPSFDGHKETVKKVINGHYIDTASISSSTIRDNFKPLKNEDNEIVQALIDNRIDDDAEERSEFAAESIANTTHDNYKDYIKSAIVVAAASEILLSKKDIADEITDKFDDEADSRLDLISLMETGEAYNSGQSDELEMMGDVDAEFDDSTSLSEYKPMKTWTAILDEHTRPAHAEADGQTVEIDEPFIVDGEELMEPMDDSLGASPENIINCRCTSVTSLE